MEISKRPGSDPIDDARVALAHITHQLWIKNVSITESNSDIDIVAVDWEKQGGTTDVDFNHIISKALSLRGYITLIHSSHIPKTHDIPGLRMIEQSEAGVKYRALEVFVKYLANNPEARANCANQRVVEIRFNFEEINPTSFVYTGGISTTSAPNSPTRENAYNIFAQILQNDDSLIEKIRSPTFSQLDFTIKPDGFAINVIDSAPKVLETTSNTMP